jgi:protein required for attachment to host cells
MNDTIWVLTANRSFAKVYEVKNLGRDFLEILHLDHPDGRKKGAEIFTDRPGRSFDSVGGGRHALSTAVDVHEHDQQVFTKQLATLLQEGLEKKSFTGIAIVAPSHFLGDLNLVMSPAVKKKVVKEIPRDLPEGLNEKDRIQHLCDYLDLWNHKK